MLYNPGIFIAHQYAWHTEGDIVLAVPSLCPSVRHTMLLYVTVSSNFSPSRNTVILVF